MTANTGLKYQQTSLFGAGIPMNLEDPELKTMFGKLEASRSHLHHRWEDYSGWTLPYVYPTDEYGSSTEMQNDYQSVGAQAVNHLTNKIVSTMFPASRPFFRIDLAEDQKVALEEAGFERSKLSEVTATAETQAMRQMEVVSMRTSVLAAMKSLIVTGNSLMYTPKGKKAQTYSLKDYVIQRDMSGTPAVIITRDTHQVSTLPKDLQNMLVEHGYTNPEDQVQIFTGIFRMDDDKYIVKQEIDNTFIIPRKKGVYTPDNLPWVPLTWNLVRGHDYGNGLVEEAAGDFHTLSTLAEALLNLSSIVSDIKGLVNPMGQTDIDSLNNSTSGTWVYGLADDVSYLQLEKFADMNFLHQQMETYSRRVGAMFLLNTAVTRNAERVTAQEIRIQANELEESLGGVYSRLAEELQQPLAKRLLASLDSELSKVEVHILTGVESLSRQSELDQIMMFFQDLALLQNVPDEFKEYMKPDEIMITLGSARHVDYKQFLKTKEEVTEERNEAQQREEQLIAAKQSQSAGQQQQLV